MPSLETLFFSGLVFFFVLALLLGGYKYTELRERHVRRIEQKRQARSTHTSFPRPFGKAHRPRRPTP